MLSRVLFYPVELNILPIRWDEVLTHEFISSEVSKLYFANDIVGSSSLVQKAKGATHWVELFSYISLYKYKCSIQCR